MRKLLKTTKNFWNHSLWHKILFVVAGILLVCVGTMYGIARWYIASESSKPLILGTSFIPAYAESLGVDPQQTMDALIHDAGVKHFRLVSYWDQLEPQKGQYNFDLLDWQFQKAEQAHATVSLSLGLRQPRWPECHMPTWAQNEPASQWEPQLNSFIAAVVNRYKNSPALNSYQLENEYFIKGFGRCQTIPHALDRSRLVSEYNLLRKLDPAHTLIINRSNNALGWPVGQPQPDEFGISIYKRVWDATITHRYFEYPFPAWFYAFTAGWQKIFTGRDMVIHELQAESWGPRGANLSSLSLEEANKSFNAQRFKDRVEFGEGTGMREMYLWGSEYWYARMIKQHDPSLWNVAKQTFQEPS